MTEFPVKYRLYQSDGSTLVYTFPFVQEDNSPQDPKDYVEISGLRGVGSLIIPGSTRAWDLNIRFILTAVDYQSLIAQMDALETTIVTCTKYVLKIDRTSSTTKDYNVMRLLPFVWGQDYRTSDIEAVVTFRVNSWS